MQCDDCIQMIFYDGDDDSDDGMSDYDDDMTRDSELRL